MKRWAVLVVAIISAGVATLPLILPLVMVVMFTGGGGAASPAGAVPTLPGVNPVMLQAYGRAVTSAAGVVPDCTGIRWSLLAGIAQVESGQAGGREVSPDGWISPPVIGPALDGSGAGGNRTGFPDTDGGAWDGDIRWDRAVGPFQFIPSSWRAYGQDGNGDGVADPHNAFDAALSALVHLCGRGPRDLSDPQQLDAALFGYNRSRAYVADVQRWAATYEQLAAAAAPASSGEVATSERGQLVIDAASAWMGTPYSWGGGSLIGPSEGFAQGAGIVGFDCSGLTRYAYAQAGLTLPRVSRDQWQVGTRIPREAGLAAVAPGDLVFFATNPTTGAGIHHVAIYMGGGQMLNAARTGTFVRVEPVWMSSYAGAVRP